MAYADEENVERAAGGRKKLIQLTDLDNAGQVDEALLLDAIAEADSWINSYFEPRYAVPTAAPSEIMRRVSAQLTVYILKQRREALTDADQTRFEDIVGWLNGVRRGEISPGIDPRPPESTFAGQTTKGDRELIDHALTRDKFEGYL
jgi:phage gp36-like protein